jgi:hypothetical protein
MNSPPAAAVPKMKILFPWAIVLRKLIVLKAG